MRRVYLLFFVFIFMGCDSFVLEPRNPPEIIDTSKWYLIYEKDTFNLINNNDTNYGGFIYRHFDLDFTNSRFVKVSYQYATNAPYYIIAIFRYLYDQQKIFFALREIYNYFGSDSVSCISDTIPEFFRRNWTYDLRLQRVFPGQYVFMKNLKIYRKN